MSKNTSEETRKSDCLVKIETELKDKAWGLAVSSFGQRLATAEKPYANDCGRVIYEEGKRTLDEYRLIYISEGKGYFESASVPRTAVEAGTMILLFPGEWHQFFPDEKGAWYANWVGFSGLIIDNMTRGNFFSTRNCIFNTSLDSSTIDIYHDIKKHIETRNDGYQQYISSLVMLLLGRTFYKNKNSELDDGYMVRIINRAKMIMKEESGESGIYNIEDIAKHLNVSYSQFRREFKRSCGISPGQYRQELKLSKAKELLHHTNMSIADIASKLNFECLGQFSTFFRKRVGIPPLEYRKKSTYDLIKKEQEKQQ